MTRPPKKALPGNYKVGYGRPPTETRFRKGVTGNPGQANYAAAKSAILGLTREFAVQAAADNVRVNCVVPGYIVTDATAHLARAPFFSRWSSSSKLGDSRGSSTSFLYAMPKSATLLPRTALPASLSASATFAIT